MKLLMITPHLGNTRPLLAFIPGWVRALAAHLDHLWVITPHFDPGITLPENVHVVQVGRPAGARQTILASAYNFHRALWRLLSTHQVDAVFTHMYPEYALLALPYARLFHRPIVTWYAHAYLDPRIKLAAHFVDRIVTTSPQTFIMDIPKRVVVGQGIDTDFFAPLSLGDPPPDTNYLRLVHVGRISSVKNIEVLLQAMALLNKPDAPDMVLTIVGDPPNLAGQQYLASLRQLTLELELADQVNFQAALPYSELPAFYQGFEAFLSDSDSGADKAILEAMSCGLPAFVSHPTFKPILGELAPLLSFNQQDPASLAQNLFEFAAMTAQKRHGIGSNLRQKIIEMYALSNLAPRIIAVIQQTVDERTR